MRVSSRRVAARYIDARVVPFRRDREYAAYHAFIKKVRGLQQKVDALEALLDSNTDAKNLLYEGGLSRSPRLHWNSDDFLRRFDQSLGGRRDIGIMQGRPEGYEQDRYYTRLNLKIDLQRALDSLQYTSASDMADALQSSGFRQNLKYYADEVSDAELRTLREGVSALNQIRDDMEMLLKRMVREQDPSFSSEIPASAEMGDVETLYHASVKAKELYRDGFSDTMPAESASAGLGGSQSLGSGKGRGISFTEDLYVAKEIARVFKEVAMIARGEVPASTVLEWVKRSPHTKKIIEWYQQNYMPCGRECIMDDRNPVRFYKQVLNDEHLDDVKAGRAEYDPRKSTKRVPVDVGEAYPSPEGTMGLYLSYLNFSGRYDPKFFGVGGPRGLVKRFKGLNPRDIGFIKATVNTAHPDATYGKGEREVRVPPEAVLSVDKFIG